MGIATATALLLDVFDLQERDRIVTFLTAERGKKRGVARGSRTKFSRFAGQLQPLATVEVSWFEKDGRDLVSLSEISLVRPVAKLQEDLEGLLLTSYMADHMKEFAQEEEASEALFRLLDSTLSALLAGTDRWLAVRYYEVWMLRLAGIFPVPRQCPLCGQSLADGAYLVEDSDAALVCLDCGRGQPGRRVGTPEIEFLRRTGSEGLPAMADGPPIRPGLLAGIEDLCARIRRSFLQAELRSYRVMKETLQSL